MVFYVSTRNSITTMGLLFTVECQTAAGDGNGKSFRYWDSLIVDVAGRMMGENIYRVGALCSNEYSPSLLVAIDGQHVNL